MFAGYPLPRIDDMINNLAKYRVFSTFDLKNAFHLFTCSYAIPTRNILDLKQMENFISSAVSRLA